MCLPSCPTYLLTGSERSSPRGRIALIRAVHEGDLPLESPKFQEEMNDCLGCLACVSACPAGVDYGGLLERARDQIRRQRQPHWPWWKRSLVELALRAFEQPWVLQWSTRLLWLVQRSGLLRVSRILPHPWAELSKLLPQLHWKSGRKRLPTSLPGRGRGKVAVLAGCVMDVLFPEENVATMEALQRQGFHCQLAGSPGCCGALQAHSGQLDRARKLAQGWIEAWEDQPLDALVVNSAGCGSCMKHYPALFQDQPEWAERARRFSSKVKDVHEFLEEIELDPPLPQGHLSLTYHDACHLAHGQGQRDAPRRLLKRLAHDNYREMKEADLCCGSAGTYNVTHFEAASQLLDRKVASILESGADIVGVANPGCLLQIRYGLERQNSNVRAAHPIVLLNEAWRQSEGQKVDLT